MLLTDPMEGTRFGKLKVLRRALITQGKKIKYVCECDCGNQAVVQKDNLKNGHTTSCGCERGKTRGKQLLLPHGLSSKRELYRKYKDSAIRRGYEFSIDFDTFIKETSKSCYYCGREPSSVTKRPKSVGEYVHNGVDRVDNSKGYFIENCVPCCTVCNRAKGNMTFKDFMQWIREISIHSRGR